MRHHGSSPEVVVPGGSLAATLELWASSLRDVTARLRPLFMQERMAVPAGLFLDGLLGEGRRKTGWMRAEAAGDPGPWRQQSVLGRGQWDAGTLRGAVRGYALATPAEAAAASRPPAGLAALVGWRWHHGATPARLALRGTGRPVRRRVWRQAGRCLDPRPADTPSYRRRHAGVLPDLVPGRHAPRDAGWRRRPPLLHRGQLRDGEERTRPRPQRDPVMARPAPSRRAGDAGLRHDGKRPSQDQRAHRHAEKNITATLVRWSLQEIRPIATRLARQSLEPAHVIACSLRRRAHQAAAHAAHIKKAQP